MKVTFVSDCHGKWNQLNFLTNLHCLHNPVVALGDVGFWTLKDLEKKFPKNFYFISGALSIDQDMRIEGISWWRDEELNWAECQECLELYNQVRPKYVISHDFPECISAMILKDVLIGAGKQIKTKTGQLLNQLFQDHKPELWIGGHYHLSFDKNIMGTRFICMPELGIKTLDL